MDSYQKLLFHEGTHRDEFHIYTDLKDLITKSLLNKNKISKCRTIGILQSNSGKFYLTDIDSPNDLSEPGVQVSVKYLKAHPQSTNPPYPVQLFGTLQWKNRPVIFANVMQVMSVPMAIRIRNALSSIIQRHLACDANVPDTSVEEITDSSTDSIIYISDSD